MQKRWPLLGVFFLLFLASCWKAKDQASRKIGRDKMVKIMADLHIADAVAEEMAHSRRDSVFALSDSMKTQILRNRQVSQADFKETFTYYTQHPDEMDVLYEKVIQEITDRETKIK